MTRGGFTLLRILTIKMFSLSLSCLTSSTAPCQPTTAWRPCRSTATSARSSSTNATSEWLAVCPPCCRETPTRHTFSLLVQVRESQTLHGGLVSCPCHSIWPLNMLVTWEKWVYTMSIQHGSYSDLSLYFCVRWGLSKYILIGAESVCLHVIVKWKRDQVCFGPEHWSCQH